MKKLQDKTRHPNRLHSHSKLYCIAFSAVSLYRHKHTLTQLQQPLIRKACTHSTHPKILFLNPKKVKNTHYC